jgi:NAD(P)-dependent dehydrogenase (short-subunit alcohol dehydrogenase family)
LEIAKTIEFLIENEYVNGSTIKVTGGLWDNGQ